jgi:ATP-dependent DNA helicase PIF1
LFSGVGKSAAVRMIAKWAEKILRKSGDHPHKPRVLLTGPTGMASAVIGGVTIHSAFDFKFGNEHIPLSDKKIDEFRNAFENLHLIIVDEMSMLSSDMLYKIHRRLCEIFQTYDLFGGKSMILVGDLLQLPPVKGNFVFDEPRNDQFKVFHDVSPLWELFEPIVLEHNHRQGDEKTWADTLNRLRQGIVTDADKELLKSRVTEETPEDCCNVFYTNAEVHTLNMKRLDQVKATEVKIPAIIRTPLGYSVSTKPHGTIDSTQFMKELAIKIGARVMLVFNVNTCDDLVNGAFGTVRALIQKGQQIDCIVVEFDNDQAGSDHRKKYPGLSEKYKDCNGTPIYRHELEYIVPTKRQSHSARTKIIQFPLRLAWANTAHKVSA